MTNAEAIETLRANYPDACFEQLREAVDAAIEALKAQDAVGDTISRQAAIDAILDLHDCYNGFSDTYDKACIIGVLEELPSADVVEVVRCKDCKHYIYDGDRWLCKVLSNNYEPIVDLDSDGYCSYGERRTDGCI